MSGERADQHALQLRKFVLPPNQRNIGKGAGLRRLGERLRDPLQVDACLGDGLVAKIERAGEKPADEDHHALRQIPAQPRRIAEDGVGRVCFRLTPEGMPPQNSSASTMPNENRSDRWSSGSPRTCSGDI